MADVQSQEEFAHFHRDGLKDLDIEQHRLAEARSATNLGSIDDELKNTLKGIHEKLSDSSRGPEHIFQQAIKSLKEADLKRFIIENALEAMKNQKSIHDIVDQYTKLGLIAAPSSDSPMNPPPSNQTPLSSTLGLLQRKSIWERVTGILGQISVNAIKSVPKWVEIEPHVGFVGPVPTITFGLKAKGLTVHEFLEVLRGVES